MEDKQATKRLSCVPVSTPTKPPTEKRTTSTSEIDKTSLGKRKKSELSEENKTNSDLDPVIMNEDNSNSDGSDLDSVMREPRKKIRKLTHSNTIDGESFEKKKSEIMLEPSFVYKQTSKIACACGSYHTITLSNDGTAHSFGRNKEGQLGLGHNNDVSLPTPIPNLPQIKMVSCGDNFTVCVDHEGFIWSFGSNNEGQLGIGNKTNFNVPQKLLNIPPVLSVDCGYDYTLIITNDDDLWSWGCNDKGQLCHGDTEDRSKPQKTSFSNISKIAAGWTNSLFQNNKGEIFSCGNNQRGQCGLGHSNKLQITPSLILNAPSNIVEFVCGGSQNLFLDCEGNVFSVGFNVHGQLGLGHNTNQNELNKIPNIPPIKIISCVSASCYLIDFEGNLWSFGHNSYGQLGHGDKKNKNTPKIVNTLKDIQQISYGCCGEHFIVKNSQNQIFVTGKNNWGQLGIEDTESVSFLKEINSEYSTIWRDEFHTRAKSARK